MNRKSTINKFSCIGIETSIYQIPIKANQFRFDLHVIHFCRNFGLYGLVSISFIISIHTIFNYQFLLLNTMHVSVCMRARVCKSMFICTYVNTNFCIFIK